MIMSNTQHKESRPGNRRLVDEGMKLHLRVLRLNGKTWRVLTLRPGTEAAFSTGYLYDGRSIVSDTAGMKLLSRILWGVSYQREPGTIFLLHGEHLKPSPSDAERSHPIILCPLGLSTPDAQAFRELKKRLLRLGPPTVTVRLHSFGREAVLTEDIYGDDWERYGLRRPVHNDPFFLQERFTLCGGMICYGAPPPILRFRAAELLHMGYDFKLPHYTWTTYRPLADQGTNHLDGEGAVQVFNRYPAMVSEAMEARKTVVATSSSTIPDAPPEALRTLIETQTDIIAARRRKELQSYRRRLKAKKRQLPLAAPS